MISRVLLVLRKSLFFEATLAGAGEVASGVFQFRG
jgi:hypothetical protein